MAIPAASGVTGCQNRPQTGTPRPLLCRQGLSPPQVGVVALPLSRQAGSAARPVAWRQPVPKPRRLFSCLPAGTRPAPGTPIVRPTAVAAPFHLQTDKKESRTLRLSFYLQSGGAAAP